jgi:hypothetical protein
VIVRSWTEVLGELERVDFELARTTAADGPWMTMRSGLMRELTTLPTCEVGRAERLRLAQAVERTRQLQETWHAARKSMQSEAEDLYASQLLLRALQPANRQSHISLQS